MSGLDRQELEEWPRWFRLWPLRRRRGRRAGGTRSCSGSCSSCGGCSRAGCACARRYATLVWLVGSTIKSKRLFRLLSQLPTGMSEWNV